MYLRAVGCLFTQMNAYFLVMNSKRCNTQEKLETMVMQIWGRGVNKMHCGLCENCEWMENVKNDSNIYPSFSLAFFNRLSRSCQGTESHSRTNAPPSPLPNKSSSYASYISSINSSQQGRLISKQNIISQLAAVQHKLFNSNTGVLFFCHFPLQSTHTGPRAQNDVTF